MAEQAKIPYVDATWNPWIGCRHATIPGTDKPHPGCVAEIETEPNNDNGY